ncbi:MAG: hypothetical protein ABI643_01350 [Candidatus Doudnabacteria bacterium]
MEQEEVNNISALFKKPLVPTPQLDKPTVRNTPPPSNVRTPAPTTDRFAQVRETARKTQISAPVKNNPVKKDFGVIDFSKKSVVRGVSNTEKTRSQLYKQLGGVFNSSTQRSEVTKELGRQISSGGIVTRGSAKKALWNLQKAGKLTSGQVSRTFKKLGM